MKRILLCCLLAAGVASLRAQQPPAASSVAETLRNLRWRSIGPAVMSGRVTDVAGIPGDPSVFYVAAADGGIFKTTNGGMTFGPIFDGQEVLSVGAIALAPSDANVLWAGTGEGNPRNSVSFGNGVYRSTDAGETWTHLGLADTERIARIRVDPRDSNTAYVAALGHEWGANPERGLFKTTDGGRTWSKILYVDQDTGCSDVELDPSNPRIVYAGMYSFRRKPWRFDSGGGATALFKSVDGGATWRRLTNGLPKGPMDRIGVAAARSRPETVYLVTNSNAEGVLFRSDDRGESWRKVSDDPNINSRPFYFSDVRVDPNDAERIYLLAGGISMSRDGGRTFERVALRSHPDQHALWIDPLNSKRILSGNDGGVQISYDGAKTFESFTNLALSQFYHVAYDMAQPYHVCGGLQDNYNWCGPSATLDGLGIRNDDWYALSGGDGFFVVPDLGAPDLVYTTSHGGNIHLVNRRTGSARSIHPRPVVVGSSGGAIAQFEYRFNWNSPVVLSPHDPSTAYFGGNVVFKTTNRGQSWDVISPDLTTNDKSKQQSSGGPVTPDNTAAEFHCTILTIAESPVKPGIIWVGTDDGHVQVTRDGGKTWTNVVNKIPGLPQNSWIPTIEASHGDAGTAYVAVDRHQDDDFGPYVFKTTDYGQTWAPIKGDLPAKGYVHVVREDPTNQSLLYVGTELGVFASWDAGGHWVSIRNNLPPVAVRDIAIHPRDKDLILATHGRGVWVLDDATPLQDLGEALGSDFHVFDVRPAMRYEMWRTGPFIGDKTYTAENPPYGALISYYLKAQSKDRVTVRVADQSGTAIRELADVPRSAGINRVVWDLRHEGARVEGGRGRAGSSTGPIAVPGNYTVTVTAGGREFAKAVQVRMDPRITISQADLQAQLEALVVLRGLTATVSTVITRTDDLVTQLTGLAGVLNKTTSAPTALDGGMQAGQDGASQNVQATISRALAQAKDLRARLARAGSMGYRELPRLREMIQSLSGQIGGAAAAPTEPQKVRLRELSAETDQVVAAVNTIISTTIPEVNRLVSGHPHIVAGPPVR